jgi:hypothetical protein
MSDSNHAAPQPPDDLPPSGKSRPKRAPADEEAIDFSHYSPAEDALSFASRSGPRSGSSVITWKELVQQQSSDDEALEVHAGDDDDLDVDSDKDLLREVLADEPPPSGIIYKDPSGHEVPALPPQPPAGADRKGPGSSFVLPPSLEAARAAGAADDLGPRPPGADSAEDVTLVPGGEPGGSSILPARLPGGSGVGSDVWSESSRVDLLGDVPPGLSSDALGRTDEIGGPPAAPPPSDDGLGLPGRVPPADESSAVDLGAEPMIELPFPLGLDSSVSSAVMPGATAPARPPAAGEADSGQVDLLASSREFELGLRPPGASTADELAARREPPSTVPLATADRGRAVAWAGGGAIGLLAGVAATFGLMSAGLLPGQSRGRPDRPLAAPAGDDSARAVLAERDAALAAARAAADRAQRAQADLTQRLTRADADAAKGRQAQAELDRLTRLFKQADLDPAALPAVAGQLTQARTAAEQARQARAKLDELTAQLQRAQLDPADLPAALQRLGAARTAAEDAVKTADAQLARLREQVAQTTAEAKAAEDRLQGQLAQVTAARQALTTFAREVARRLEAAKLVAADPAPPELLAALDRALERRPGSQAVPDPAQAQQYFAHGWHAYRGRDYAAAEQSFTLAVQANDRDARYQYFLGLARLAQGRSAQAAEDFRRGAALERQNLPNAGEVDRALESVPHEARRLVGMYRP